MKQKYKRPIPARKYNRLREAVADNTEKALLDSAFPADETGKRGYQAPVDKKTAKRIEEILKAVHKARRGPRMLRLVFLLIILISPVLFNLFFLDRIAGNLLESGLENLTRTDVGVSGLDIQPMKARIDIRELSFASLTDSMKNDLVLSDLTADFSWKALLRRRIGIENLGGTLATGSDRIVPAVYPAESGAETKKPSPLLPVFADLPGMLVPAFPEATINQLQLLRTNSREDYEQWSSGLEQTYRETELLLKDVGSFLTEPVPAKTDARYWTAKVETARGLAGRIKTAQTSLEEYQSSLKDASVEAGLAVADLKASISADLAEIQSNLTFDEKMLDQLISTALVSVGGPRMESLYQRIRKISERFSAGSLTTGREPKKSPERMKRGRIVAFPVTLPPRFTIENLRLAGPGVEIRGRNVGIDHHLAGAPSTLEFELTNRGKSESRVRGAVQIDGRSGALHRVSGSLSGDSWPWQVKSSENGVIGGMLSAASDFRSGPAGAGELRFSGTLKLNEWTGETLKSFPPTSDYPPLSLVFEILLRENGSELEFQLDRTTVGPWIRAIAEYQLKSLGDAGKVQLPPEAQEYMGDLEMILSDWNGQKETLDSLASELIASEGLLQKGIRDWTKQAAVSVPIPGSGALPGGLGSLLGN